jgi:hypothetical protein
MRAITQRRAVVLVRADEATANMALDILNRSGAQDARERREGHRRVADQRDADQRTEDFERDYRSDFDQRFKGGGYTYEHFSPAYRYGYELAHDEALRGKEWSAVEAEARRDWDERNPNTREQVAGWFGIRRSRSRRKNSTSRPLRSHGSGWQSKRGTTTAQPRIGGGSNR